VKRSVRSSDFPTTSTAFSSHKIDKWHKHNSRSEVSFFRRISAFLLLALWLTATQHCGLEAAGVWDTQPDGQTSPVCCSAGLQCLHDGCELVEHGSISSSSALVKVPTPAMQVCTYLLCVRLIAPTLLTEPSFEFTQGINRPLGWVLTWHFERRAAPSPRAPSLLLA
jgi:hypothetical protein